MKRIDARYTATVVSMEPKSVTNFRNGRSPSSDRFIGVFSPPSSDFLSGGFTDDDLNEDDVFWTGDFAENEHQIESKQSPAVVSGSGGNQRPPCFRQSEKYGIMAALAEDSRKLNTHPVLYRTSSISPPLSSPVKVSSSSRAIPSIPKPVQEREFAQSMPFQKFQHSVPLNVPVVPKKVRKCLMDEVDVEIDEEDEMLPPHEIVARGSRSPKTTFSVLEGVGRTLKGRDLRQVRNAIWRKTGFLD